MKSNQLAELLADFDSVPGVSGYEEPVAEMLQEKMDGLYDEHYGDELGNSIFVRKGKNESLKVMICSHMDELGFIVSTIEDNGLVRFAPVGFHTDRVVIGQQLEIHTDKGIVCGVTGSKPFHIMTPEEAKVVIEMKDLFIDVGTYNKVETEELGVKAGDSITFATKGHFFNNTKTYCGKSVDDRAGLAIMTEVMSRLKDEDLEAYVYAVGTVQEELGCRGAGVAAHKIQPNIALALDVTLSGGVPGVEVKDTTVLMGKGPSIGFYLWAPETACAGNVTPRRLTSKLVEIAEKNNIPYQRDVLMGAATDGWSISLSGDGVLAGSILFPSRYIHSSIGTVHLDDLEAAVNIIVNYIKQIKSKEDIVIRR